MNRKPDVLLRMSNFFQRRKQQRAVAAAKAAQKGLKDKQILKAVVHGAQPFRQTPDGINLFIIFLEFLQDDGSFIADEIVVSEQNMPSSFGCIWLISATNWAPNEQLGWSGGDRFRFVTPLNHDVIMSQLEIRAAMSEIPVATPVAPLSVAAQPAIVESTGKVDDAPQNEQEDDDEEEEKAVKSTKKTAAKK